MDEASLRTLIRGEFRSELAPFLEEGLRSIFREELIRHTGVTQGDGKITLGDGATSKGSLLEAAARSATSNGSLREAAAGSNPVVGLPGSATPPPTPPGMVVDEYAEEDDKCPYTICVCGNKFMADTAFCRKCGERRPEPGGESQEEKLLRTLTTKKNSAKPKKPKKKALKLFKQNEPEPIATPLQRFTHHKYYEASSAALIIFNSACLGIQTQTQSTEMAHQATSGHELPAHPVIWDALGFIFCFLFTVELGLRWKAEGLWNFMKSEDMWWNVLDITVVSTSIVELLMDFISYATSFEPVDALGNVSVLRVLRVIRVIRVAKVIRVMKFFRELRMMIYSILGCVKNLLWVFVILMTTFYVFGVAFASATIEYLDKPELWLHEDNQVLIESFGTLDKSMLSLFMSMSGGNDWSQYYECLTLLPFIFPMAYLSFILFCLFAVVNIITGIFVESAMQSNLKDRDVVVHEELEIKKELLGSMEEIFHEMDEDGKGTISLKEFESKLQDERVVAYFSALKLDVSDAQMIFQLIDYDKSDEINVEEFLDGIYKLQGESRSLDMRIMQYEVRFLKLRLNEIGASIREGQKQIRATMRDVQTKGAPKEARPITADSVEHADYWT